jgi:hypothetical protein
MSERKLVYIASPYAGDIERNIEMTKQYCRLALQRGCDFIAPHLIYPQVLNDSDPFEREKGMQMGLRQLPFCSELWICGEKISSGMQSEIAEAERLGIRIVPVQSAGLNEASGEKWGVWAKRSSISIFGSAEAWVKSEGKVLTFDNREKATERAATLMKNIGTANVSYFPKRIEPELGEILDPEMGMKLT